MEFDAFAITLAVILFATQLSTLVCAIVIMWWRIQCGSFRSYSTNPWVISWLAMLVAIALAGVLRPQSFMSDAILEFAIGGLAVNLGAAAILLSMGTTKVQQALERRQGLARSNLAD